MRSRAVHTAAGWHGLVWVYSAALWLLLTWLTLSFEGDLLGTLLCLVRLLGTLAVGIGLCGSVRSAWAVAVCASAVYAVLASLAAAAAWVRLATLPPSSLSWMPVAYGLTSGQLRTFATLCLVLVLVSAISLRILQSSSEEYDVGERGAYGILVRDGLVPALAMLTLDLGILALWWLRTWGSALS